MLTSLFPQAHTRYTTLPVLGRSLEGLCAWLVNLGYPHSAIRRRVEGAPLLDKCLDSEAFICSPGALPLSCAPVSLGRSVGQPKLLTPLAGHW